MRVAEHLDLDVARLLDELLDEDAVVAEARCAPRCGTALKPSSASLSFERHAQALAAAAGRLALIITG